jgi:hypothetical protein
VRAVHRGRPGRAESRRCGSDLFWVGWNVVGVGCSGIPLPVLFTAACLRSDLAASKERIWPTRYTVSE